MSTASVPRRILCAEDNPDICELIAAILTEYEVISVTGVVEASEKFRVGEFALAVLDYHLIDGDGLTICRHIREADPLIPIVFITGDPDLTIEEVLSAGGKLLIDKGIPRFIDELIDAAERLLDGKPSLVTN